MTTGPCLVSAGPADRVQEGSGTVVTVADKTLALFQVGGEYYAVANTCPHQGGPLGEGELCGHVVTCPWHGWTWDVRTGANTRVPALKKLACFPVTVVNGELFVEISGFC